MAFSLEAAIVVPVSMTVLVFGVSLAIPAYDSVRLNAVLTGLSCQRSSHEQSLYVLNSKSLDSCTTNRLQTDPGKLIRLCQLAEDLYRPISGLISATAVQSEEGFEGEWSFPESMTVAVSGTNLVQPGSVAK